MSELELKQGIERTRSELAATVDELSARLNRAAQQGKQMALRAGGALAVAVLVVLLVRAARGPSRRSGRDA